MDTTSLQVAIEHAHPKSMPVAGVQAATAVPAIVNPDEMSSMKCDLTEADQLYHEREMPLIINMN